MNRRHKIIISVTGITLVILILVGLTYAYFLTRIKGNTNEKSIGLKTANLKVKYQDGSDGIIIGDKIQPGAIFEKNFSVKNIGDDTGNYSIILDNIENTLERTWDVRYTLKTKNGEELVKGTLGKELRKQIVYADIDIEVDAIDEYIFELEYEETNEDQSIDMKKSISLKIDIIGAQENIFKDIAEENTLLYVIGRDNKIVKPLTIPGQQKSPTNEAELSYTEDDYGTSYYFRGNPENNFIVFNNMCWRIVRVLGNGDIKITLYNAKGTSCSWSYSNALTGGAYAWRDGKVAPDDVSYEGSQVDVFLKSWYSEKFTDDTISDNLVENATWCNDRSVAEEKEGIIYYGSYKRLFPNEEANPSLKCNFFKENGVSDKINLKIALLTADEVIFAGGHFSDTYGERDDVAGDYYLHPSMDTDKWAWWTMSPGSSSSIVRVSREGRVFDGKQNQNGGYARPTLVLSSLTILENEENNGTVDMPYIVKESN